MVLRRPGHDARQVLAKRNYCQRKYFHGSAAEVRNQTEIVTPALNRILYTYIPRTK